MINYFQNLWTNSLKWPENCYHSLLMFLDDILRHSCCSLSITLRRYSVIGTPRLLQSTLLLSIIIIVVITNQLVSAPEYVPRDDYDQRPVHCRWCPLVERGPRHIQSVTAQRHRARRARERWSSRRVDLETGRGRATASDSLHPCARWLWTFRRRRTDPSNCSGCANCDLCRDQLPEPERKSSPWQLIMAMGECLVYSSLQVKFAAWRTSWQSPDTHYIRSEDPKWTLAYGFTP